MKNKFIKSLSEISSANLNKIINEADKPFMSYEYLYAYKYSYDIKGLSASLIILLRFADEISDKLFINLFFTLGLLN